MEGSEVVIYVGMFLWQAFTLSAFALAVGIAYAVATAVARKVVRV